MFASVVEAVVKNLKVNKVDPDAENLILRKVLDSHIMVLANIKIKSLKKLAEKIADRKEVLAVEYLDKKKVFGIKASLDEMKLFKSKVKK
jgi:hypothetical protein